MKPLQTILALLFIVLLGACAKVDDEARVNKRRSDTTAVRVGELLMQRDSLNGVNCYHRYGSDVVSCLRDPVP